MTELQQYLIKYRKAHEYTYRPKEYYPAYYKALNPDECDVSAVLCSIANMGLLQFSFGADILDKYIKKDQKCYSDRAALWDSSMANIFGIQRGIYTNKPVRDFDLIMISGYMVLQVFNVVPFFLQSKMHPLKDKRKQIVILGGNLALTYRILEPYVDIFYFGDGEPHINRMIELKRQTRSKAEYIEALECEEGIKDCIYTGKKKQIIPAVTKKISNSILDHDHFISKPVNKVIEVARGCKYDCNFCLLSHYKSPYRSNDIEAIERAVCSFKKKPTSIYPFAPDEASYRFKEQLNKVVLDAGHVQYSYNKRFDTFVPEKDLAPNKSTSRIVFGLDGISERLRQFGNKRITQDQIYRGLEASIKERSVSMIKLNTIFSYYCETEADYKEYRDLLLWFVHKRNEYRPSHRELTWKMLGETLDEGTRLRDAFGDNLLMLNIAATPFLPEPGTPFEFMEARYNESIKMRFSKLIDELKYKYTFIKNEGLNGYESWLMELLVNRCEAKEQKAYMAAFQEQGQKPFVYNTSNRLFKILKINGVDIEGKKKEMKRSYFPEIKFRYNEEKRYKLFMDAKAKL